MPQNRVCLVIGLGNPGDTYKKTRHNAGFMGVDEIANAYSILLEKRKFSVLFGRGFIECIEVILAKPMAFMNRSGEPIKKIANYFRIPSEDMLVIHDDIDLAFGRLKIKEKGGHGGHKGISSLIDAFGEKNFDRLRIGIGRPEADISVSDHVLDRFTPFEMEELDLILKRAKDAVVTILCKGTKYGMNIFNKKEL